MAVGCAPGGRGREVGEGGGKRRGEGWWGEEKKKEVEGGGDQSDRGTVNGNE